MGKKNGSRVGVIPTNREGSSLNRDFIITLEAFCVQNILNPLKNYGHEVPIGECTVSRSSRGGTALS